MTGAPERAETDVEVRGAARRWRYRWLHFRSGGSVLRGDAPKGRGPRTRAPPSPPFAAVGRLAAVRRRVAIGHAIVGWGLGHHLSTAHPALARARPLSLSLPVQSLHRLGGFTLAPAAIVPAAALLVLLTSQLRGHRMHEANRLQPL